MLVQNWDYQRGLGLPPHAAHRRSRTQTAVLGLPFRVTNLVCRAGSLKVVHATGGQDQNFRRLSGDAWVHGGVFSERGSTAFLCVRSSTDQDHFVTRILVFLCVSFRALFPRCPL
jgi:hypothetical protein